jgi:hypothetical protein
LSGIDLAKLGAHFRLDEIALARPRNPLAGAGVAPKIVIPGSPDGRGPESMNTGLWNMASGLAAARRPGMTARLFAKSQPA